MDALVPPLTLRGVEGRLDYEDGRTTACSFEIVHEESGNLAVVCHHEQVGWVWREPSTGSPCRLSGVTDSGLHIRIEGEFVQAPDPPGLPASSSAVSVTYSVNGPGVTLQPAEPTAGAEPEPALVRYHLVNFSFWGNVWTRSGLPEGGSRDRCDTLSLSLDGCSLSVVQRPDYDDVQKRLRSQRGTAVTCTAQTWVKRGELAHDTDKLMDRLCCLLTLASGGRVTWVSKEVRAGGTLLTAQIRSSVTRPYSGWRLIDTGDSTALVSFLETAYPVFVKLEGGYELGRVIDARVDALTAGFLETRTLIAVVLGEYLSRRYSELNGRGARSFEERLRYTARSLCSDIRGKEIDGFIQTRNKLSHEMRFRTDTPSHEHKAAVYMIDRLVLGLLGYTGPYIDCRTWQVKH